MFPMRPVTLTTRLFVLSSIPQEVLPAIKLVKYYAWEQYFEKQISEVGAGYRDVCCCAPPAVLHRLLWSVLTLLPRGSPSVGGDTWGAGSPFPGEPSARERMPGCRYRNR